MSSRETASEENATAYFPIFDRIADGYFSDCQTDKDLYDKFIKLLKDEKHISSADGLSTFDLALSIRSAAPRIEAQYQFYDTAVKPVFTEGNISEPANWIEIDGRSSYLDNEADDLRSVRTGSLVAITVDFSKSGKMKLIKIPIDANRFLSIA